MPAVRDDAVQMLLCVLMFVLKCCWLAPSVSLRTNEKSGPSVKSAQTEVMTIDPSVSLPAQEVASEDTG